MAREVIQFFQAQLIEERVPTEFSIVDHVTWMIIDEQNEILQAESTMEEVKVAVFGLNWDSVSGPEGFTSHYYQSCFDIIGNNMLNMVKGFFCGLKLSRFITRTNIILLPKKNNVATFI